MTKVFFATDLHGSEICWRKFLNAPGFYGASVLILGGDMTGKALIPIIRAERQDEATLQEHRYVLESEDEVQQMERRIAGHGDYPVRISRDEVTELQADPGLVERLFQKQMQSTLEQWMALAKGKLEGTPVRCYVCPGNDDRPETDEGIVKSEAGELAEGGRVEFDGGELLSTGRPN